MLQTLQGNNPVILIFLSRKTSHFGVLYSKQNSDMKEHVAANQSIVSGGQTPMENNLQQYFPMIRTKEELLKEIHSNRKLERVFNSWQEEQKKEFVDFCTGACGVKMLYDFMAKEILNPEVTPERVDEFLSLLLKQKVHVIEVLPNEGTRLADESSLVVMDIVVQLEDRSIANLEIQKIGYHFPGERSACYSADLLLRQYKRVRSRRKKQFSYKDMRNVYTIVLFEHSPAELKKMQDVYIHRFEQSSDTGVKLDLLQKYIFVTLDIFDKIQHNEGDSIRIQNRLEAWLAFMSMDAPEDVITIISEYPDFRELYEQVYDICQNIEGVMDMFSKELRILDRNTVQLMIDEMQEELEQKSEELEQKSEELEQKSEELEKIKKEYEQAMKELKELKG